MKKKLEAELISIAHRILKLKNRADLDVLQQETLKLYEKISVLRFVEDNFSDVKPTIGYASAEETLEEIYGIEETPVVHANEQEAKEEEAREEKKAKAKSDKEKEANTTSQKSEEEPQEETPQPETDEPEGDADPEQPLEEYQASEEEKEHTKEETDEEIEEEELQAEELQATSQEPREEETRNPQPATENSDEEPEVKIQVEKPAVDVKAMEDAAAAVYKKEDDSTVEEEEQAADAEVITIAPDDNAKVDDSKLNFDFAFDRPATPETPKKQKEITFEDYHDYKEPEFVKKGEASKQSQSQKDTRNAQPEIPNAERDWRDWEPAKDEPKADEPKADEPKAEEKPQATSFQSQSQSQPETRNPQPATGSTRSLNLGLNDRIAFEKNLFGGSGEDLNRVISQLNTFDSFDEAKEFIADMVKPDYNNWQGKEEYEERFMALVEKKFN
ncbi:MAG: hypothetical protein ACO1N9_07670 [Flavobacterium sp.]